MALLHRCSSSLLKLLPLVLIARSDVLPDFSQYVNPFMGILGPYSGLAYGGGDVFVGSVVPFGVSKVGIDTHDAPINMSANSGGFTPRPGLVTGVSMMHESGTGGGPKYGIVSQMPLTDVSDPVNLLDNTTYWQSRADNESAAVGYFQTSLQNGVGIELSGSRHGGIFSYRYPGEEKHVLVDVSHYLPYNARSLDSQYYVGGVIEIAHDGTSYTGYTSVAGGWCLGAPVTVYFCGEFDKKPVEASAFVGKNTFPTARYGRNVDGQPIPRPRYTGKAARSGPLGDRVGALFSWNSSAADVINSRVGISFISTEKACKFKDAEIPYWNVNDSAQAVREEWNRDVFSKVQVSTGPAANRTRLRMLYSSLYFMHMMPSDRTGENPLWESNEPSWDDFYTMWDIFRNTVSFWHLTQPSYYESMIRSLIDMWRREGYLPDGRSGNYNGLVQGGSNADNVLADAYVKGMRGDINWTDAYHAVRVDAEIQPQNDNNPFDPSGSLKQGRSALNDWLDFGYVSYDRNSRCVSKTVEYALNDFAVSQIAAGIAPDEREKYLRRSAGWQLSWNHDAASRNFTGFVAPRSSKGSFNESYDLAQCGDCNWKDVSYEATPFEYSFSAPHDMETLVSFMGGPALFERRLDYIFLPNTSAAALGPNGAVSTLMNVGDEPDFLLPYLYNYINKQSRTVEQSRALGYDLFSDRDNGLPGNSDAGALNSWLVWLMLGLYPVATTPVYLFGSPWFDDLNMTVNHNATLRIRAEGLDDAAGRSGFHVQGIKINGQQWSKNWFEHDDMDIMTRGGEITFQLGSQAKRWEQGPPPPSPGHVSLSGLRS